MTKTAEQAASPAARMAGAGAENGVVLNGRYALLPQTRLPAYDSATAEAYGAVDLHSGSADLFALVCPPDLPPRREAMAGFAQLAGAPLLVPEDWGVVDWLPNQGRRNVIVLQRPAGERLQPAGTAVLPRMKEYQVRHGVLLPLMPALAALQGQSLTHCAIRADNLFYADRERSSVILGEAVSGPPGFAQPAVYETIERAMALPAGRGPGSQSDDLYALGVTLSLLLRGNDPCAGMTPQDVVAAKLRQGSYNLLIGKSTLSLSFMELLRGLLCDDGEERWTLRDLESWASGRHMSPKQASLPPSAQRPFEFAGETCWSARALAHAMACHWDQAVTVLEQGKVERWLRHSLSDEAKAATIADLREAAGPSARDALLARVLMVLDPRAPLRYRSLAASIDSVTAVLALRMADPEIATCYAEAVSARLPQAWFAAQKTPPQDLVYLRKDYDRAGQILAQSEKDSGTETGIVRCLYEFNADFPCQSPMVQRDCVMSLGGLLDALERLAEKGPPETPPIDLHIAAYCAARLRRKMSRELEHLFETEDPAAGCRATLALLAQAQGECEPRARPRLAAWLAARLGPAIEGFHNRVYRAQLSEAVTQVAGEGDLRKLALLLGDETVVGQDRAGFAQAQAQYRQTLHELHWLQNGGMTDGARVTRGAQQGATVVSAILSGLALVGLTLSLAS